MFCVIHLDHIIPYVTSTLRKIKNAQEEGRERFRSGYIKFLSIIMKRLTTREFEEKIGKENLRLIKDICYHGMTGTSTCMNFVYMMVTRLSEKMLISLILPDGIEEKKNAINTLITHAINATRNLKYNHIKFSEPHALADDAMCAMNSLLIYYYHDQVIYDIYMSRVNDFMICFDPIRELDLSPGYIKKGLRNHIVLFSMICTMCPEKVCSLFLDTGMLAMAVAVWRGAIADVKKRELCFDALIFMTEHLCRLDQRLITFSSIWVVYGDDSLTLDMYQRVAFNRISKQYNYRIKTDTNHRKEARQAILELCDIKVLPSRHPLSDGEDIEAIA